MIHLPCSGTNRTARFFSMPIAAQEFSASSIAPAAARLDHALADARVTAVSAILNSSTSRKTNTSR